MDLYWYLYKDRFTWIKLVEFLKGFWCFCGYVFLVDSFEVGVTYDLMIVIHKAFIMKLIPNRYWGDYLSNKSLKASSSGYLLQLNFYIFFVFFSSLMLVIRLPKLHQSQLKDIFKLSNASGGFYVFLDFNSYRWT